MIELWIRPITFDAKLARFFPIRIAKWEPPITDAIEDAEGLALALSRQSSDLYFDIEMGLSNLVWIRYVKGKREEHLKA